MSICLLNLLTKVTKADLQDHWEDASTGLSMYLPVLGFRIASYTHAADDTAMRRRHGRASCAKHRRILVRLMIGRIVGWDGSHYFQDGLSIHNR